MVSIGSSQNQGVPRVGENVPRYVGQYKVLDLLKLQFSKLSKKERAQFSSLMERPKLEFRDEWRFNTSCSNREFRRRWHQAGKGPFHASEHTKKWVLSARPEPGPLVKAAKFLRKREQARALAHKRKASSVLDRNGPASGPLPPYRGDEHRLAHLASKKDGSSSLGKTKVRSRQPVGVKRIMMMTHMAEGHTYSGPVGGTRISDLWFTAPPPVSRWKKYWYFYRTYGQWRPSEHHPYGDEVPVIRNWLSGRQLPD